MADQKITALGANTTPLLTDLVALVDDPSGTPATEKMEVLTLWSILNPQRGFLINGKIVPTVASDDITVAIKGLDGNDPSATNPVYCRIGDTVRAITAALSVTKAAGTNWFNAGGTTLATQEIDYFVYLGYNATDGVVIGFARFPSGTEYDSFHVTSTNEKYCAISDISNAAAGDDYELIGRFAATLAAGAGYEWTVPTYSNKNLIQKPVYKTRLLAATPVYTGFSADPTSVSYGYEISEDICSIFLREGANGTSNTTGKTLVLPFSVSGTYRTAGFQMIEDNEAAALGRHVLVSSATVVNFYPSPTVTNWTNSGGCRVAQNGVTIIYPTL